MPLNRARARKRLAEFDFQRLFIEEMNWNSVPAGSPQPIGDSGYMRRLIAEMSGVAILEVFPQASGVGLPDDSACKAIHSQIERQSYENVIIFLDDDKQRTQSQLYWVKREDGKKRPRRHVYLRGQPGDLIMAKIDGMIIEMDELLPDGSLPISAVTGKLTAALDIERVTKRFYSEFSRLRLDFIDMIEGIENDTDRFWYASVLLNRLMFIYFLQKKGFIQGDLRYLEAKLKASQARGRDRFYSEFLEALFFEGFAKPAHKRSDAAQELLGEIPYLNGGLFLRHPLEDKHGAIHIPDRAFDNVLRLFGHYSWYLDDTQGARDNVINPDVLGYIFEKYINQKAFGAYYTRSEITDYLCERSIDKVILQRVNRESGRQFKSLNDALMMQDAALCRRLLFDILPRLSILDPACGSGAFLVAAMKRLLNIYGAVYGKIDFSNDRELIARKEAIRRRHPSLHYYMRKQIIINNLYGVDIMEEAAEIAKLRLFLALVSVAQHLDELEPLPNIDFNIMAGNSLIGLLKVDATRFDSKRDMAQQSQQDFLQADKAAKYRRALDEKNRLIRLYRGHADPPRSPRRVGGMGDPPRPPYTNPPRSPRRVGGTGDPPRPPYTNPPRSPHRDGGMDDSHRPAKDPVGARLVSPSRQAESLGLQALRERINQERQAAQGTLNAILLDDFQALKIQYEQARIQGKPVKRQLESQDIADLKPFHWGYEFDEIIETRGGFDVIITNPPWEVFQTDEKEFFQQFDPLIQKKKLKITDWKKQRKKLLEDPEIAQAWLAYVSSFPHVSRYIKAVPQFRNQISRMDGRIVSRKINLYSVFLEQCFNLLREGGACGIVIPSGIYSDLGTKQLRSLLFEQSQITSLFGFENRQAVFEGVHRSFKFIVLTYLRGGQTESFPAAFMRHDAAELSDFPALDSVKISVDLVRRSSPSSLSITEFKSPLDVQITEKMLRFPLLGEALADTWNVKFRQELNMTSDSDLFFTEPGPGRLPLYEGKMIWQFQHGYAAPRYWIDEAAGRRRVLGKRGVDAGQRLDYQMYRLGFRKTARQTDKRSMIMTILPRRVFCNDKLQVVRRDSFAFRTDELLALCACLNAFVSEFTLRQRINTDLTFMVMYQLPVPRLKPGDRFFAEIVDRAAQLICTAPEYDELAAEVGLGSHRNGVTEPVERAKLRAELDGMIAHVYGLSESEFAHVLASFPLVDAGVKVAALACYRQIAD